MAKGHHSIHVGQSVLGRQSQQVHVHSDSATSALLLIVHVHEQHSTAAAAVEEEVVVVGQQWQFIILESRPNEHTEQSATAAFIIEQSHEQSGHVLLRLAKQLLTIGLVQQQQQQQQRNDDVDVEWRWRGHKYGPQVGRRIRAQ